MYAAVPRLAFHQLHDQGERAIAGLFEPVNVRDVRMVDRRERFCFAAEARDAFFITRELGRQDLQGNIAIEFRIARAIHLAHSAGAERAGDRVRADAGALRQGHGWAPDYMLAED
jgi:hypothetical protein